MFKREEYYNNLQNKLANIIQDGDESYNVDRAWSGNYNRITVSQAGFFNIYNYSDGGYASGYEDSWQLAVHVAISYYRDVFVSEDYITSYAISVDLILDFLKIKDRQKRTTKRIEDSLSRLQELGFFEIKDRGNGLFIVKQVQSYNATEDKEMNNYFNLSVESVFKIIDSNESDNNRVNMIAAYCAIASSTNRLTEDKYNEMLSKAKDKGNWTKMNLVNSSICYVNQSNLALSVGMKTAKRFKKYLGMLFNLNIIFVLQVKHPININYKVGENSDYYVSNYYTLYEDRSILYNRFYFMMNNLMDSNSKTKFEIVMDINAYDPNANIQEQNQEVENDYIDDLARVYEENQELIDTLTGEEPKTYVPNKHKAKFYSKTDVWMDMETNETHEKEGEESKKNKDSSPTNNSQVIKMVKDAGPDDNDYYDDFFNSCQ